MQCGRLHCSEEECWHSHCIYFFLSNYSSFFCYILYVFFPSCRFPFLQSLFPFSFRQPPCNSLSLSVRPSAPSPSQLKVMARSPYLPFKGLSMGLHLVDSRPRIYKRCFLFSFLWSLFFCFTFSFFLCFCFCLFFFFVFFFFILTLFVVFPFQFSVRMSDYPSFGCLLFLSLSLSSFHLFFLTRPLPLLCCASNIRIFSCVRVCVRAGGLACVRACGLACISACMHVCHHREPSPPENKTSRSKWPRVPRDKLGQSYSKNLSSFCRIVSRAYDHALWFPFQFNGVAGERRELLVLANHGLYGKEVVRRVRRWCSFIC